MKNIFNVIKIKCFDYHKNIFPYKNENYEITNNIGHISYLLKRSAKKVQRNIISIPYICSRWYRAPELLCGSMFYTALGCIIFELINLCPLFPGKFKKDEYSEECSQIINLIEVIGSPQMSFFENIKDHTSKKNTLLIKELCELNIKPLCWDEILGNILEIENPNERLNIDAVLSNPYFSTLNK
ncbi:hypothetical protein PFMG_01813 [Plasmodium falciparum IGH-CR14]|uniref:Protein kinase domain-containing protein n=1 Tax=Plasmodium falciparum IGH-CR14 TaxID=580059 RepID=A0A0L1I7W6_PLAFA|nr:hypothetical protein PFMG_01813 [Plasmodium falciparum IGH-CR14]